ncbi:hypothetical protein SAMN05216456_1462 [Devosia crocina]|uniref:Uncharacterized protein n=1 Tax=Devosia crocina TaxID=429728 RepID=A0A1I7NAX3_9HYPH|nr:hypothetical protein [Devosia crocina]SFV31799.1 hypothetical protein SAMN05216456_1462 [Devosia crocina]
MQAQREAHIVAAEWVNGTELEMTDVRNWRQRMATVAISLDALLSRSDFVHPASIHALANAKVIVDGLVADLAAFDGPFENGRIGDLPVTGSIVEPHIVLERLMEMYDSSMRGVVLALDDGDDALPIQADYWRRSAETTTTHPSRMPTD